MKEPALIMDGKYLVKEKITYSNDGQCIALQNLCAQRKTFAAIHRGFCLLKQSFCQRYLLCLCLGANCKYFLNTLSHANSFPHECTNPTFVYALSGHEVTQKQEHIKVRFLLWYSLLKDRKQLGILHAKAMNAV